MLFALLERFPFALAHGTRSSSLFERVIHRSGDSTWADHALATRQCRLPDALLKASRSDMSDVTGIVSQQHLSPSGTFLKSIWVSVDVSNYDVVY